MTDRRQLVRAKVHALRVSRRAAVRTFGGGLVTAALALAGGRVAIAAQTTAPIATPESGARYVAIRRYQLKSGKSMDELVQRVETGFVPIVRSVPGFVEYYFVADDASGEHATISVFRDQAAADESTRRSADWIQEANIDGFIEGAADVTSGLVRIHANAATEAGTPTPS